MTWGLGAALFPDPRFCYFYALTPREAGSLLKYLSGMHKAITQWSQVLHSAWLQSEEEDEEIEKEAIYLHALVYINAKRIDPSKLLEQQPWLGYARLSILSPARLAYVACT